MHCCETWEPVGKCFDQCSFECIDFHGLSQIIASSTRERIAEREAEICNLPWTQTETDNALAKCRLGLCAWRSKKPMLCLHAVTDEDGHPLENEDVSGRRPCEYWSKIFEARIEGERHHCHEIMLGYVQKAPDDIRWEIVRNEFDELMVTKKCPNQVPMGFLKISTGAREDWVLSSSFMCINVCLRVALFPHTLLRVGPSSFPHPILPTSTTMVSSCDRRMH